MNYLHRLYRHDNLNVQFELDLLLGETHSLNTVSGNMSLFVDSYNYTRAEIGSMLTHANPGQIRNILALQDLDVIA